MKGSHTRSKKACSVGLREWKSAHCMETDGDLSHASHRHGLCTYFVSGIVLSADRGRTW